MSPEFYIALLLIVGVLSFLTISVIYVGRLASRDADAKAAFLKLINPASLVSLLILLGVLFLLGMAILDLDKGRVLIGMGKATFARGLITYLFAVVTIGTAVVLVLSALLGTDKEKFDNGKEVLSLLLGVFGTIVGFYFASELSQVDDRRRLSASPVLVSPTETASGTTVSVTVAVHGGTPPYRYAVVLAGERPEQLPELARPDGWIVKAVPVPATMVPGVHQLRVFVQDAAGDQADAQTLIAVKALAGSP
jgi:hypothetical protein